MTIRIHIPGPPRGKGRPRTPREGGRPYTPQETAAYENLVKLAAQQAIAGDLPYAGALWFQAALVFPVPASASKKKRAAMLAGDIRPAKKPDFDNVVKAILDGLNGVAFHDDAQITDASVTKRYGEKPGAWIALGETGAT